MRERDAVNALSRAARREQCTFQEYPEAEVSRRHIFSESLVVGIRDESVTFLYFGSARMDPPSEVLTSFKHLNKVIIRTACGRSLAWMKHIHSVTSLEIFQWNDEELPTEWDEVGSVERLFLETVTGKVPNLVRRMKNLRQLGMSSGQAIELPDWLSQLKVLERIYLRKCVIKSIPESLWRKTNLPFLVDSNAGERGVFLSESHLEISPENRDITIDMYRHSFDPMEEARNKAKLTRYYHNLRIQTFGPLVNDPTPECMVIFLGDGSVGKSSLIDRLIDRESTFVPGYSSPTNGVRMITWNTTFGVPGTGQKDTQKLSLRMMDFGGQEIMHAIHRCFMTDNTVYVVVCDSRVDTEIDFNAVRWLDTISTFAPGSPVILALNKVDLNANVSVNQKDLRQRYPELRYILRTTARSEPEYANAYPLSELEARIKDLARHCDNSYSAGAGWISVKQELEALGTNYITVGEYQGICEKYSVMDPDDQREMLKWFRELGVVYSYSRHDTDDRETDGDMEGAMVLAPQWLSNGIYRIILSAPTNDVLTHDEIRKTLESVPAGDVLPETTYIKREDKTKGLFFDEPMYILHVMRSVKLSQRVDEEKELIPARLSKDPPETVDDYPFVNALHLRWEARYLPANIVHRLMIKRYHQLQRYCMWRTGAMFCARADGGSVDFQARDPFDYQALVTLNDVSLDLYVAAAEGRDPRAYLWQMRGDILGIMGDISTDLFPEELPCWTIPGENGREIKMPLSRVMQSICNASRPDRVEYLADFTILKEEDRRLRIIGAQVNVMDVLENVYLYSDELINDYHMKLVGQNQQNSGNSENGSRGVGLFRDLRNRFRQISIRMKRRGKKRVKLPQANRVLNAMKGNVPLLVYALGVVCVFMACISLFFSIGLPSGSG